LKLKEYAMNERLNELEIKASLTEDLLEELNRMVYRQQQQIDMLQEQLRFLYGKIQANSENSESPEPFNLRDEIPPHY
jgi:SlyX protein